MPQFRPNKAQTPINSDAFNLIPDLATLADTIGGIVSVADRTEADSIDAARAAAGWPITNARPLYVWNQSTNSLEVKTLSGWRGGIKPFGHMGRTNAFQSTPSTPTRITMEQAQILRGGMTFDDANDALVVPIAGYYRINLQYYTSGAGSATQIGFVYLNTTVQTGISIRLNKVGGEDAQGHAMGVLQLAAGDKIQLYSQTTTNVSTWGTNGTNGSYIEVEYLDQW